jgi:hypothetical protein
MEVGSSRTADKAATVNNEFMAKFKFEYHTI